MPRLRRRPPPPPTDAVRARVAAVPSSWLATTMPSIMSPTTATNGRPRRTTAMVTPPSTRRRSVRSAPAKPRRAAEPRHDEAPRPRRLTECPHRRSELQRPRLHRPPSSTPGVTMAHGRTQPTSAEPRPAARPGGARVGRARSRSSRPTSGRACGTQLERELAPLLERARPTTRTCSLSKHLLSQVHGCEARMLAEDERRVRGDRADRPGQRRPQGDRAGHPLARASRSRSTWSTRRWPG